MLMQVVMKGKAKCGIIFCGKRIDFRDLVCFCIDSTKVENVVFLRKEE